MAIINNNVKNVKFLRNLTPFETREAARQALVDNKGIAEDGTSLLARYTVSGEVKTIVGYVAVVGETHHLTIIDVEGASGDVEELRREINAKLGTTFISSGNTVEANLTALSGNVQSTSAETSVEGAKRYADELKNQMDYTGVTTGTGVYVTNVTETDGVISATTESLPTVAAISETGKPITAVSESLGTISATAGTINAQYVNIADSGSLIAATNVEDALAEIAAEIDAMDLAVVSGDGEVITAVSETDGVVSASKTAIKDVKLTGYVKDTGATGDIAATDDIEDALSKLENKAAAITISNADGSINVTTAGTGTDINVNIKSGEKVLAKNGNAGLYTDIKLSGVTPSSTTVKEEYSLIATDGSVLGTNIKIYKDSHIVSITYITDPTDAHYQNLEYKYIDASGETKTEYVDISSLVLEAEFESGVTATDGVVHGVVDSASEKDESNVAFLTVGADGFKVSGIKDAIDTKINKLDAVVTGGTTAGTATSNHVQVIVGEADGKLTGVTVTETNIADADDLTTLSGKTITEVESSNSSISASTAATTDGTVKVDVTTDADKIKMSGFSADSTSSLSGIAESDSIATAFEKTNAVITENERVTAQALNDLNDRVDAVSGDVETIKPIYLSGVSVNGSAVTVSNHVAPISITAATSATTAATSNAIVVNTDANGNITLGLNYIDCGTY